MTLEVVLQDVTIAESASTSRTLKSFYTHMEARHVSVQVVGTAQHLAALRKLAPVPHIYYVFRLVLLHIALLNTTWEVQGTLGAARNWRTEDLQTYQ